MHEGQQVMRGQQVGAIGTNHGMYPAHLHFEIRKNLSIGFNQSAFAKDLSNYYQPTPFILAHRTLPARAGARCGDQHFQHGRQPVLAADR